MTTIKFSITVDTDYVKAYVNREKRQLVLIVHDEYPESPREWDNIGTIAYKHRRYRLGEEEITGDVCDWLSDTMLELSDNQKAKISKNLGWYNNDVLFELLGMLDKKYIWLPLYLYDHSGTSISTRSFNGRAHHAEWDSAMVGIIYLAKADLKKHGYTAKWLKQYYPDSTIEDKVREFLKAEIETYDQYMRGDVYGFRVIEFDEDHFDPDGDLYIDEGDETDSCYGHFGDCDDKEHGWLRETGVELDENDELTNGWEEL